MHQTAAARRLSTNQGTGSPHVRPMAHNQTAATTGASRLRTLGQSHHGMPLAPPSATLTFPLSFFRSKALNVSNDKPRHHGQRNYALIPLLPQDV